MVEETAQVLSRLGGCRAVPTSGWVSGAEHSRASGQSWSDLRRHGSPEGF